MRKGLLILALFVSALLAAAEPPTPQQVLGFTPGDDYKLADYSQITKYFHALAAAAPDRIKLVEIGKSELGKPIWLAYISSPENLKDLEKYRRISERLALGRAADEREARALAAQGKAIVWIDSGLHASEVATAQHSPELAYRMVAGTGEELDRIRRNVILLQVPCINPDGLDWVAHWYMSNVGTSYESAPLPWLYHKYAGHDNNRDWFMLNLAETRAVTRVLYHEWFPQILYNHHQAPPFPARIFVPPYAEPLNPHIPAPVMEGIGLLGMAMSERFARENKPGIISYKTYDAWWNGGLRSTPAFHNIHGLLTEVAGYSWATPHAYTEKELPERFADGLSAREPSIFYQRPFLSGRWGLRDPIEYMLTADMAVLTTAADRAADFLLKGWQLARASIEAGKNGNPYAYVLAPDQWDWPTTELFLSKLMQSGVEVHRSTAEFEAGGRKYPAAAYVLLTAQPFRPYLMDLVEPQKYPEIHSEPGRPTKRPYDIAGWTLAMQMGVKLDRIDRPFAARLERVEQLSRLAAAGGGKVLLLDHRENEMFRTMADLLKSGAKVKWAAKEFQAAEQSFGPGTAIVTDVATAPMGKFAHRIDAAPDVPGYEIRTPRVALYQPWIANADEGWTEWLFDNFGVPYTLIHNEDFRKGDLASRFDTIVLASQTASSILRGFRPGEVGGGDEEGGNRGPQPTPTQRPEYAGGIELAGLARLEEFVRGGGTLVTLESAGELPMTHFPLALSNRARTGGFYCPGSLLRITVDPAHPLAYGMPREAVAFSTGGAAFQITWALGFNTGEREIKSAAKFAEKNLLASGWLSGERAVAGKDAVVEARHGKGRVILIAFRPQFRGQPHGTFKFLLNAVYLGSAKEAQPAGR